MNEVKESLVLKQVLRMLRPAVRLLLRSGVTYVELVQALKREFYVVSLQELQGSSNFDQSDDLAMGHKLKNANAPTTSAISLLSGLHRADVRQFQAQKAETVYNPTPQATGLATQVVARWLSDAAYLGVDGLPAPLRIRRGKGDASGLSFNALVQTINRDVRPQTVLMQLIQMGLLSQDGQMVRLTAQSFTPSADEAQMLSLMADNVHDHLLAATENVGVGPQYLEQAVFSDGLTIESIAVLRHKAKAAWSQSFQSLMTALQQRFEHDAAQASPQERKYRFRFGSYAVDDVPNAIQDKD